MIEILSCLSSEMDEDGSGTVDFEVVNILIILLNLLSIEQEFVILMKKRTADSDGSDDIEAAFKVFDTKNDGYVEDPQS